MVNLLTGITYNFGGNISNLFIDALQDGVRTNLVFIGGSQLTTPKETQSVPEPSTVVGLGLLGLGLLGSKKKSKV
ncbi:PEP-CTERM sorting domain-containing protein [Crocosphaera sp. UHCC 0190]|uniref:PEP-CTERM sorting domain-containing protein n=1 Tax=Crocosphaera sp. UHCC 0190 TaxID=3110246 RepID=UPI002B20672B|nr:PEP-CTERM sorting domain-containing protein [Crocosphaera sp. UHCC 0190]MEA5511110.1 PEP-CTERM sorting domain-containing protein [Crocosphaera sp. UHCC 0190]